MWDDNRKYYIIKNVVLFILLIGAVGLLVYAALHVMERTAAEDKILSEAHTQQLEAQNFEKQEALQFVQDEYQKDMDTVAEYLPGIVCWGDTITAGTAGGISYPTYLQNYINTYITDVYSFKYSIPDSNTYSRVDWDSFKVSIPVVNMGGGNENSSTILGRAGVRQFILYDNVTVPAEPEKVKIRLTNEAGDNVTPMTSGNSGVGHVTIGGISGTLTPYQASASPYYYFTRDEAGEETLFDRGTEVISDSQDLYKNYVHVICIGTYDPSWTSAAALVQNVKELISRQLSNTDRYIVLGISYMDTDWLHNDSFDDAMTQEFGEHYINVRKYLCTDGVADAGFTAGKNDTYYSSYGIVPVTLRSASNGGEYIAPVYKLLGKLVYDRMDKLGYFDEVKEELYINETSKALIANNPDYFKNIINSWY